MSHTNLEVAVAWTKGKVAQSSNGNLSSTGELLISYRTPIAAIVKSVNGEPVALIDQTRYSMTTEGKHVNAAYKALASARNGRVNCFRVPYIVDGEEAHYANLAYLRAQAENEAKRILRARVYKSEDHLDRLVHRVSEYRELFGLEGV